MRAELIGASAASAIEPGSSPALRISGRKRRILDPAP
jgi:hypothetical protein